MMRRIAHQTSGEAKPLSPVQDHALSVSATSVAPRFKSNSDTSTQATLRTSCSQGLPKPEGRFCIRFSTARSNRCNQFSISVVGFALQSTTLMRPTPGALAPRGRVYRIRASQSWSAFGKRCKTGSWRVGPRYLIRRRKIGLSKGFVCNTYRSSGTSSQSRCSFGS